METFWLTPQDHFRPGYAIYSSLHSCPLSSSGYQSKPQYCIDMHSMHYTHFHAFRSHSHTPCSCALHTFHSIPMPATVIPSTSMHTVIYISYMYYMVWHQLADMYSTP